MLTFAVSWRPPPSRLQDGFTAVHWAAIKGKVEILKFVVEGAPETNRGDPAVADHDGWTALHWAIEMVSAAGKGRICRAPFKQ